MKKRNIGTCPGPGLNASSDTWYCDGAVCKAGGDWHSCKEAIEHRGYFLVFTQDAKAAARATGENITDSYGNIYGK